MSALLTKEEIQELSTIRPVRLTLAVGLWWFAMVGLMQLAVTFGVSWISLLCVLLMGCLQNGMILWTHEGSHYNIHRDKKRNDLISDLFICGPVGISVDGYRWHHSRHHKYLGDPKAEIELSAYACIRGGQLLVHMGRHLFGYVAYQVIFRGQRYAGTDSPFPPPPARSIPAWIGFVVSNAGLFGICAIQGAWFMYFVVWVFPLFTIAVMVSNFRTIVEHQPSADVCDSGTNVIPAITRIVDTNPIEQFLIAPVGFHYHYEHHLYPGLPYYSLPKVRRKLLARGHYDSDQIVRSKGYIRTIWKLSTKPDFGMPFLKRAK